MDKTEILKQIGITLLTTLISSIGIGGLFIFLFKQFVANKFNKDLVKFKGELELVNNKNKEIFTHFYKKKFELIIELNRKVVEVHTDLGILIHREKVNKEFDIKALYEKMIDVINTGKELSDFINKNNRREIIEFFNQWSAELATLNKEKTLEIRHKHINNMRDIISKISTILISDIKPESNLID